MLGRGPLAVAIGGTLEAVVHGGERGVRFGEVGKGFHQLLEFLTRFVQLALPGVDGRALVEGSRVVRSNL